MKGTTNPLILTIILCTSAAVASTTNPLILGSNEAEMYDPTHDVIFEYGNYRQVKVDNSELPKSFYVVYDKKLYGTKEGVATQSSVVPPDAASGSSETVRTSFDIASAQGFDIRAPGIILFEHPNYIGNARQYHESNEVITASFPPNDGWNGVSSVIVTGGRWRLYAGENMMGAMLQELQSGQMYSSEGSDRVQSIERLDI